MTGIRGVVFDLDGVLVHTDDLHRAAWGELADRLGWSLDDALADSLRGVSRSDSLDLIAAANGATVEPASTPAATARATSTWPAARAWTPSRPIRRTVARSRLPPPAMATARSTS